MDALHVAPGELLEITSRPRARPVRVTQTLHAALAPLRAAMVEAARGGATVTWPEASAATGGAYPPIGMGAVVDALDVDCARRGEPPLGALVARRPRRPTTGEDGGTDGDAELAAGREACWAFWREGPAAAG